MRRPTQADVARLAGVSRATVSYVISGRARDDISIAEETRRRVLKAVEQLGYQPNASAQSLRRGQTRTIGLLVPDLHNPHYWQIVRGVEEEARARGYEGEACTECGNFTLVRNGTCLKCDTCGGTTGCS